MVMPSNDEKMRGMIIKKGKSGEESRIDSIQIQSDFLIECLKESSQAELNRFWIDLGDWVFSDEKILASFNANLLDLFFREIEARR